MMRRILLVSGIHVPFLLGCRKGSKSEISLDIKIVPKNYTSGLHGSIEVIMNVIANLQTLITTEEVFKKIGYVDKNNRRIACCDDYAYTVRLLFLSNAKANICKNKNHLLLPKGWQSDSFLERTALR